ncbi:G-type lectin S-receptor-like serine/threonine-protein kinase SD2-5 [Camellia lanceoleosa]|uniref:G-type lectin S-receptor-like serine/threonine-protein kinase SD2-5 n=1 Tax=Camellia lanceoleosa TaxID=1840588 RepID=A0ACC0H1M1_9ERIC|nr:G-type lectin S-receptor-like serine/threonine-protein kinase SD2-5 [Camellia lanceoleosa]
MLCGRKNLDRSQPEEDMHLLSLFKRKAEEGRLNDIVDKYNDEMQLHGAEVVEMMRVAVWCLQSDFSKRPSMSMVVKVLEGSVDVEKNLDYNFTNPAIPRSIAATVNKSMPLVPPCHYSIVSISSVWTEVKK